MRIINKTKLWLLVAVLVAANLAYTVPKAFASTLTKATVLELGGASFANPMITSSGQQVAVDFKTTASAGATSVTVNFSNFSGGTVNTSQTTTGGCTTYFPSATAMTVSGSSGSGTTISLTVSALSANTEYCTILNSTTAVTNPGTSGVYSAVITEGSDSQTAAFDVLSSGNSYSITGIVDPTFTMSVCGSDSFGSHLSASALTVSTGCSVSVSTNAASGWNLYARDANSGLHSTSASHTINSVAGGANQTMNGGTIGTEAYALAVTANNTANYAYNAGTTGGALSSAAYNQVASNASPANNVSQTFKELVDISPTTQPGTDYTDTITVIGSGQF